MGPESPGDEEREGPVPTTDPIEALRLRDEFLGALSQEFRNPLAAIQTAAEVLSRGDVDAGVRRQAAEIVDRQLAHLRRLLDEVRDFSRATLGRLAIRRDRVDVVQVLRDAALASAPKIDRGRHVLQVDLPADPAWVVGDSARLFHALVSLIDNAVRDASQGSIVSIEARVRDGVVDIEVRDAWQSLSDQELLHLFDPFALGEAREARGHGGLGLGMALASRIIAQHAGEIRAALAEGGVGLRIGVRLPLMGAEEERIPSAPPGARLRVLVVEDNDDARQMLAEVLRIEGHEVSEACDGEAGLAALLETSPDVALLDIGLPVLDGYEIARRVRSDPRGQRVRLVAITGYGMPKDVDRGWEAGFDHYLVKPVQFAQLNDLFATLVGEVSRGRPSATA